MSEKRVEQPEAAIKVEMLRRMMCIRHFDEAAVQLQARGRLPGPMHTSIGQEAEVVGACMALASDDYMTGNHRSHGHPIGKGAALRPLMAELLGKATGVCRGHGGSLHLADFSVGSLGESGIVGAGIPIAAGAALSAKLRGTRQVALAFFGDGATNSGPFHEALNLAAIWKLPAIFVCENNGYAVTTSARDTRAIEQIASRATSYGIPGVTVDGQDLIAVWTAVSVAVDRARAGDGPTLLDVQTYRYRDHSEFGKMNTVKQYRTDDEVEEWRARDPIALFSRRVSEEGVLDPKAIAELEVAVHQEVEEAVEFAVASPYPEIDAAFEDLYVNPIPVRR